jgi:hypothetical protein
MFHSSHRGTARHGILCGQPDELKQQDTQNTHDFIYGTTMSAAATSNAVIHNGCLASLIQLSSGRRMFFARASRWPNPQQD